MASGPEPYAYATIVVPYSEASTLGQLELGGPNGVASLDATGNVPEDQLGNVSGGGALKLFTLSFEYNTPNIGAVSEETVNAPGVAFPGYTPQVGDAIVGGWVLVSTAWNETAALDFYAGSEATVGLLSPLTGQWNLYNDNTPATVIAGSNVYNAYPTSGFYIPLYPGAPAIIANEVDGLFVWIGANGIKGQGFTDSTAGAALAAVLVVPVAE